MQRVGNFRCPYLGSFARPVTEACQLKVKGCIGYRGSVYAPLGFSIIINAFLRFGYRHRSFLLTVSTTEPTREQECNYAEVRGARHGCVAVHHGAMNLTSQYATLNVGLSSGRVFRRS